MTEWDDAGRVCVSDGVTEGTWCVRKRKRRKHITDASWTYEGTPWMHRWHILDVSRTCRKLKVKLES